MIHGNIYHQIPPDLPKEVFETLAHSPRVKIERIISRGQSSPDSGWYDQAHNEWVIVLKGIAAIAFENEITLNLKPGDYVDIPAHKRHRVVTTGSEPETIWLAVHY